MNTKNTAPPEAEIPQIEPWLKRRLESVRSSRQVDTSETFDKRPEPPRGDRTAAFLRSLIAAHIRAIQHELPKESCAQLITVRTSNEVAGSFLRSLFASPGDLYEYLSDPEQLKPIDVFAKDIFQKCRKHVKQRKAKCQPLPDHELFVAIYDLHFLREPSPNAPAHFSFSRMHDFLNSLRKNRSASLAGAACAILTPEETGPGRGSYCVIGAARNKANGNIDLLCAIYFTAPTQPKLQLGGVDNCLAAMFRDIEHVLELDSALFRAEGLALIARLAPTFYDARHCPADKIGLAIEAISNLMKDHLIGLDCSSDQLIAVAPLVTYIDLHFQRKHDFEEQDQVEEKTCYHPILDIYPPKYRKRYPVSAFLIAHPKVPACVKLLLIKYFDQEEVRTIGEQEKIGARIRLSAPFRFSEMFAEFEPHARLLCGENTIDRIHDDPRYAVDQLVLSELPMVGPGIRNNEDFDQWVNNAKRFWEFVNVNRGTRNQIRPDEESGNGDGEHVTKSIAAFVIEGERIEMERSRNSGKGKQKIAFMTMPRGILAFESTFVTGFSKNDVRNLRDIASALATLVRTLRHPNASLNYDNSLRQMADPDLLLTSISDEQQDMLRNIVFYLNRLDGSIYHEVLRCLSDATGSGRLGHWSATVGLTEEHVRKVLWWLIEQGPKNVEPIIVPEDDELARGREKTILQGRRERLLARVSEFRTLVDEIESNSASTRGGAHAKPVERFAAVKEFLAAVPANYIWSAYYESLSRALSDRTFEVDPEFKRLAAGFSADALFLAVVNAEIHQVIKLSNWNKLVEERKRYRRFVRYRLPGSARLPGSGFSFDSNGDAGVKAGAEGLLAIRPAEGTNTFGALVSDLIDGGDDSSRPLTLLGCMSELCEGKSDAPMVLDIQRALLNHFGINRARWENLNSTNVAPYLEGHKNGVLTRGYLIRQSFRFKENIDRDWVGLLDSVRNSKSHQSRGENAQHPDNGKALRDALPDICAKLQGALQASRQRLLDEDRPRFDKYETLTDEIIKMLFEPGGDLVMGSVCRGNARIAICHGDLNSKNLMWSPVFKRFFVIDFEHTDYGIRGTDQWKLIFSLLADVYGDYIRHDRSHDHRRGGLVAENLERAILLVDVLTDGLLGTTATESEARYRKLFAPSQEAFSEVPRASLGLVASTIFASLQEEDAGNIEAIRRALETDELSAYLTALSETAEMLGQENTHKVTGDVEDRPWTISAGCAAVKEFLFSYRDFESNADRLLPIALRACGRDIAPTSPVLSISDIIEVIDNIRIATHEAPRIRHRRDDYRSEFGGVRIEDLRLVSRFLISLLLLIAACDSTPKRGSGG